MTPEVGLKRALEAKQQIEHLDGYLAALVRDGSTAPPPDGQFVLEKAELQAIDEGKIAGVVAATRQAGVANGPTLELFSMLVGDETPEQIVAARPELRYVPDPAVRTWILQFSRFPGQQAPAVGRRRFVDLRKRLVRELHAAGCPLLAGSDSPQIFMVPGFALHRELAAMVDAGLTPQAALETATRNARRYLGDADAGTVAPGQRADLVLLEANPLDDIRNLGRVHGVLAAARWYPREALDRMLAEVEASARAAVPAPAN